MAPGSLLRLKEPERRKKSYQAEGVSGDDSVQKSGHRIKILAV